MTDDLLHFSAHPVDEIISCDVQRVNRKPNGFWVSVGLAWPEWCVAESFALERFAYCTRVVLRDDANVLRIEDVRALDAFSDEYVVPDRFQNWMFTDKLDWHRVAERYDGIIIAPYQWSRRLTLDWYNSWDVASGCLWNTRAISKLETVALPNVLDLARVAEYVA